nr:uncharacterized protein LOC110766574 isoform X2 [Ipomoea trifida]
MHCLLKSPLLFLHRRKHEDLNLLGIIVNKEIRRLSRQVIRVKWCTRGDFVYEHLRGNAARNLLERIRKSRREMIEEQEAEKKIDADYVLIH